MRRLETTFAPRELAARWTGLAWLAALLLATDGYGNSQAEEPWQPGVGRDLAELAAEHDHHWFEQQVPGWAQRCASAEGSGDDTTIALLLRPKVAAQVHADAEGGG